jgi:hypothetical protein
MTVIVEFRLRRSEADPVRPLAAATPSPEGGESAPSAIAEIVLLPFARLRRETSPKRRKPLRRRAGADTI